MSPPEESADLHRDQLLTDDAIVHLGTLVARTLSIGGAVTLFVDPAGMVCMANPGSVYLNNNCLSAPEGRAVLVKPLEANKFPQWVAVHEGKLWEVRYESDDGG